ncbi:MAG: hypothetical protein WCG83_04800 [Candidatus Peregrinibacteria bacterium]
MSTFLAFLGIVLSVLMIKYREQAGDTFGSAEWMEKVGGVYNVIIIFAVLLFFGCVAVLTGSTQIFFAPVLWLFPHPTT